MTKALDTALDKLLAACLTSEDAEVRRLAGHVQQQRKPRGRGQPKAALPTLEEAMLPGSADAFAAWHATPQAKNVWSESEVCRQIASNHGVSTNTVKPLVRAIHARLNPPKVLGFSLAEQLEMAHKAVKK